MSTTSLGGPPYFQDGFRNTGRTDEQRFNDTQGQNLAHGAASQTAIPEAVGMDVARHDGDGRGQPTFACGWHGCSEEFTEIDRLNRHVSVSKHGRPRKKEDFPHQYSQRRIPPQDDSQVTNPSLEATIISPSSAAFPSCISFNQPPAYNGFVPHLSVTKQALGEIMRLVELIGQEDHMRQMDYQAALVENANAQTRIADVEREREAAIQKARGFETVSTVADKRAEKAENTLSEKYLELQKVLAQMQSTTKLNKELGERVAAAEKRINEAVEKAAATESQEYLMMEKVKKEEEEKWTAVQRAQDAEEEARVFKENQMWVLSQAREAEGRAKEAEGRAKEAEDRAKKAELAMAAETAEAATSRQFIEALRDRLAEVEEAKKALENNVLTDRPVSIEVPDTSTKPQEEIVVQPRKRKASDVTRGTHKMARRATTRLSHAEPKDVAGQLRAAINNWKEDEKERFMQFERQETWIRIRHVNEVDMPPGNTSLRIKCTLIKDEKVMSTIQIYAILDRFCKNFNPLELGTTIDSLGIRAVQSISMDQHKKLFGINAEVEDIKIYRWTDLGPILGKTLR